MQQGTELLLLVDVDWFVMRSLYHVHTHLKIKYYIFETHANFLTGQIVKNFWLMWKELECCKIQSTGKRHDLFGDL